LQQKHTVVATVFHLAKNIGGDIPTRGFILLPMIQGGEIHHMQNREIDSWRHVSRGSDGHKGSMRDMSSSLHQNDIPCSKGEILFIGSSKVFRLGEHPQGNNYPFPLMLKGER
jgi:hypothetical protein